MRGVVVAVAGVLACVGVGVAVLLGGTAGSASAVEAVAAEDVTVTATLTETATATATATETATVTTTETATATVTAEPQSVPLASNEAETGYRIDPVTGEVIVTEGSGLALAVGMWLASVVAGMATAKLALP